MSPTRGGVDYARWELFARHRNKMNATPRSPTSMPAMMAVFCHQVSFEKPRYLITESPVGKAQTPVVGQSIKPRPEYSFTTSAVYVYLMGERYWSQSQ